MPRAAARTSPARARLTREQVVDAALDLVDADGLEALTLRKLAVSLGVTPMALYWHVADKDALLDALGERVFASVVLPEPVEPWDDDVEAVVRAIVDALRRRPAVAPLAMPTVLTCEPGLVLAERVLSRLRTAGFAEAEAANVGAYLLSAAVTLVTCLPADVAPDDPRLAHKAEALARLPLDRYPTVARLAGDLMACSDPDGFLGDGTALLVAGVRALAAEASSS